MAAAIVARLATSLLPFSAQSTSVRPLIIRLKITIPGGTWGTLIVPIAQTEPVPRYSVRSSPRVPIHYQIAMLSYQAQNLGNGHPQALSLPETLAMVSAESAACQLSESTRAHTSAAEQQIKGPRDLNFINTIDGLQHACSSTFSLKSAQKQTQGLVPSRRPQSWPVSLGRGSVEGATPRITHMDGPAH